MDRIEKLSKETVDFARSIFGKGFIPLHRPVFDGNERNYLVDCIDSNFVSSVGEKVTIFENMVADFTGSKYAVATVNGTSALHIALKLVGVNYGDEVITQALTFVATCNVIKYLGAKPLFIDVDIDTMGLSPVFLRSFLENFAEKKSHGTYNKVSGKKISACMPMHTFGFPCRISEIAEICIEWNIALVEDSAESLGSFSGSKHTGTFASLSAFSFNGNKVITSGGGGMIITDDQVLAQKARDITTTAKISHPYEFVHDEIGYNYRMPNLNAALGCAQMERLDDFLSIKYQLSNKWDVFYTQRDIKFLREIDESKANHWLNVLILNSKKERNQFINFTNDNGVMTRPIWTLMPKLDMFKDCQTDGLKNSLWLEDRVVNIPSSVPDGFLK